MEIYIELIQLIDKHYTHERGVRFYADKLCLSAKYLTSLVKSISGNTVQQLVFKAIVKKAIFLVTSTDKSIKEISDYLLAPSLKNRWACRPSTIARKKQRAPFRDRV